MAINSLERSINHEHLPDIRINAFIHPEINNECHPNILITSNHAYDKNGSHVGFYYLENHFDSPIRKDTNYKFLKNSPVFAMVTGIIVDESVRGRGFGTSIARDIIFAADEVPVFSDCDHLNLESRRIWNRLVSEKLAIPIIDLSTKDHVFGYLSIPKSKRNKGYHMPIHKEECRPILDLYHKQGYPLK